MYNALALFAKHQEEDINFGTITDIKLWHAHCDRQELEINALAPIDWVGYNFLRDLQQTRCIIGDLEEKIDFLVACHNEPCEEHDGSKIAAKGH